MEAPSIKPGMYRVHSVLYNLARKENQASKIMKNYKEFWSAVQVVYGCSISCLALLSIIGLEPQAFLTSGFGFGHWGEYWWQ
jgi:hypothetical protein